MYICSVTLSTDNHSNVSLSTMKVKLSREQIEKIIENPALAEAVGVKANDPWWVIALKVAAYLIGLILAGVATTSCATMVGMV